MPATLDPAHPTTPAISQIVCWRMISGCDRDGRPIYNDWATGEVIEVADDSGHILARRSSHPRGTVLVHLDKIVL